MGKKLTTEEYINKAKKIHNGKYDYSLVDYKVSNLKIKIICPMHGEFEQRADHHLMKRGCKQCANIAIRNSKIKDATYYIDKAKEIHDDKYEYDETYFGDGYLNITCKIHGDFKQTIDNHLKGKGCPKCNGKNKTTNDIINDFINTHGDRYDYSKVNYNGIKSKVDIICPIHGEFKQSPEEHINGCGCPVCRESKGEREIRLFLTNKNINFKPQYKFDDCRHILPLPFDFYLPDYNTCVEYHGEQHYKPIKIFGGEEKLKITQKRDKIKEDYCKKNGITLIVIPFNQSIIENVNNFIENL